MGLKGLELPKTQRAIVFPARGKAAVREIIYLACTQCRERNYTTTKNRKNDPQRLELKRFCPHCRAHILHREVK